jgi:protein TonB
MFDLVAGRTTHLPSRRAAPIVISTVLQAGMVSAVLLPALFLTGALPEPQTVMVFVAAPPSPPPPPPALAARKRPAPTPAMRPVQERVQPILLAPPPAMAAEPVGQDEEGMSGGVEGGVPGGVPGGPAGGWGDVLPPLPPARREPVRVGGQIEQPRLLRRVDPIYPPIALSARLQGVVVLEALVDRRGCVEQVQVLRSANSLLDTAAMEAVKLWQYSPLILNETAERFIVTVVLSFTLVTAS